MKGTENLMQYINKCIISNNFDVEDFLNTLDKQKLSSEDRIFILNCLDKNGRDLTKINRDLYNYFYGKEEQEKHDKSLQKFKRNQEGQDVLEEAYLKYENYVYSIISMKNYKSKMSKTKTKVKLYSIENLYGHDSEQTLKDVLQDGRSYLWEGLKKFGVLPSKAKNFEGRMDKGFQRNIASKSTFVHSNLFNSLTNLSIKSSSEKFTHVPIEYNAEIFGEREEEE